MATSPNDGLKESTNMAAERIENASNRRDDISVGEGDIKPEAAGPEYSPEDMDAVRKKIDWRIMPLAAWACGLQFVDKVCCHHNPKVLYA
jgi:hypothetical protein